MNNALHIDAQFVRHQIERLKLDYPEMAEDAELLGDMAEGSTDLHELLARIVREERDAAAFSEAIKAQEDALASRRARFVKLQQISRSLMMSLLDTAGQTKVKLPEATISMSAGRTSCVISDEALLPDQFVKIVRSPKTREITTALAEGQDVPGALLRNNAPFLTVRT